MTAKTIKCLSCDGTGRETMRLRVGRSVLIGHSGFLCSLCDGTGYERPPTLVAKAERTAKARKVVKSQRRHPRQTTGD